MSIEWNGNILSKSGATCKAGEIAAELLRADPSTFADRRVSRRSWVLNILRSHHMMTESQCLTTVFLLGLSPTEAMGEAEQIIRWAADYYAVMATPTARRER